MIADISVDISESDDKPTLCIDKNETAAPKRGEEKLAVHTLRARASVQPVLARMLRYLLLSDGRPNDVAMEKFWLVGRLPGPWNAVFRAFLEGFCRPDVVNFQEGRFPILAKGKAASR